MPTEREEKEEQAFFAEKLKEQEQHEGKGQKMAANDQPKHKAEPRKRPEGASKDAVVSDVGATEPTIEFGGDGVTPKAEWDEKYAEIKKKQDEHDEKMRKRAVEDAGPMLTTEKVKHG
jgi:hypothetical protein